MYQNNFDWQLLAIYTYQRWRKAPSTEKYIKTKIYLWHHHCHLCHLSQGLFGFRNNKLYIWANDNWERIPHLILIYLLLFSLCVSKVIYGTVSNISKAFRHSTYIAAPTGPRKSGDVSPGIFHLLYPLSIVWLSFIFLPGIAFAMVLFTFGFAVKTALAESTFLYLW